MIHQGWRAGLLGEVVRAHALYYAREWRFGPFFEARVAREMGEFLARLGPRDAIFSSWNADTFLGSVTIDGGDPTLQPGHAHLRWFITTDAARGQGAGRRLMQTAMDFLREGRFAGCYLTTFAGLDAARRLYDQAGFTLAAEQEAESWGTRVREQTFTWTP